MWSLSPAWSASTTHEPAWSRCNVVPPVIEHALLVVVASTENVTGLPDPPPVADNGWVPSLVPEDGSENEIDCDALPTVNVCCACGAAV